MSGTLDLRAELPPWFTLRHVIKLTAADTVNVLVTEQQRERIRELADEARHADQSQSVSKNVL